MSDVVGMSTPVVGVKENCKMKPLRVRKKKFPTLSIAGRTDTSELEGATQAAGPYAASEDGLIPTTTEQVAFVAPSTSWLVAAFQTRRAFNHVES